MSYVQFSDFTVAALWLIYAALACTHLLLLALTIPAGIAFFTTFFVSECS